VADQFDTLLGGDEAAAVRWLRKSAPAGQISELEGFAGETELDTLATFSAQKPAVARRVETTYGIRHVRLQVGVELSPELAKAGWEATRAGPLDEAGLRKLHAVALSHWSSTIDDNERMFIAALMDADNARTLHVEHPFGLVADAQVVFAATSITAANRKAVGDVGRRDRPPDRSDPNAPHVIGDTTDLDRQIREMAGHFSYVADSALKLADKVGVAHASVYFAMLGGASDSTPDDRAYAGLTYVIAVQAGLGVAADIPPGRLKIDAVPRAYLALMDPDSEGAYFSRGSTAKGDTLYLPWDTDPERLDDRATIVHELTHAATDKEQPDITNAQDELRSFEAQMRYVVAQVRPLTGAARTQAVTEAATGAGHVEILAALGAIRDDADPPDPDSFKVVEELNQAVRNSIPDLAPYLAMPIMRLYDESLKAVAKRYAKRNPSKRSRTDSFRGESALD
jgi:hypothetical protein